MKEVSLLFQNKRTLLGMLFLGVLVYSTYNIQENSLRLKKITTFEGGMQTCFGRVNQTYTAKLLSDSASQYLTQNFEALSEECFAESIMNIDENFKTELASVTKKLSTLASNVHWFHEDLLAPNGVKSLANGEGRDIGSRFEKIENTKDEILEESDTFKANITKELNNDKNVFYVTATLLVVIMLLEFFANTKRKISNNAREIEASVELQDNGGVQSVKLGEIIRLALEQNELRNCAKLFNNYYVNNAFEKTVKLKSKNPLDALITPNLNANNEMNVKENIEKIWNDDSIGIAADTTSTSVSTTSTSKGQDNAINLDQVTSKMIDILADKLFSKGVQVDIKIDESLNLNGNAEVVEQVLYHSLTHAINTSEATSSGKIVGINAIKLGDLTAIDITTSGLGFNPELLKTRLGLESNKSKLDLDLQIIQSLIGEIGGRMQIDNRLAQDGSITGGRIKLILKSAEATKTSKLVNLKKGTKKDIKALISESYL